MALTQVKTSGIADDAVTLAKQASGTDGQIITYDASGNPKAIGPGSATEVLTSQGAGAEPVFSAIPNQLTDNSVTLGKMAPGTDGNLITYDASGDPAHVATGNSGQVLTSNGAGAAPTFQTLSTSSAEIYGFVKNGNNLNVTTTNGGADNISGATYASFDEAFFAATGFSWSINASGNLIATI